MPTARPTRSRCKNFVGPVNVIDCSKEAAADDDFLLTVDHIKAWEAKHGAINPGEWVVMRTDWYKRNGSEAEFLNANETGPHTPGPTAEAIKYLIGKDITGWGSETIGTDAGKAGGMEPPFPAHNLMHKANRYGLASLVQPRPAAAQGRDPDRRAAEDRARHRQPDPRAGAGAEEAEPGGESRVEREPDHIIVGSGINALVCAAMLAGKGGQGAGARAQRPHRRLHPHRGSDRAGLRP